MNFFILLLLLLCFSCGYPDVDNVPDFQKIKLTKEEAIDLCNINNNNDNDLKKCLEKINEN